MPLYERNESQRKSKIKFSTSLFQRHVLKRIVALASTLDRRRGMQNISRLRLREIIAVRLHLDQIHSGTGLLKTCYIYMGIVPPCNGIVPNWISFTSEPIWFRIGEPMISGSTLSHTGYTQGLSVPVSYRFQKDPVL